MKRFWTIPADAWRGETAVVIGGGPSLSDEQLAVVARAQASERCRVIGVNDAYRRFPTLDILYFADHKWWFWHRDQLDDWRPRIVRIEGLDHDYGDPRIRVIKSYDAVGVHAKGWTDAPDGICHGQNSGYQAVHLAARMGAARILLLGFDMKNDRDGRPHWFGWHPDTRPQAFSAWQANFALLAPALEQRGVEVINCTPGSALECFPHGEIHRLLPDS